MARDPFRLLLVEDNPGDARLIEEMVREAGADSFTLVPRVDRLASALEAIQRGGIDLVLLDLSLPDSHGLDTFSKLHEAAPDLPVIVLSGLDDHEMALKTVHLGAQDYLVKGRFDGELLARAMRYAVERSHADRALAHERNLLRSVIDNIPDPIFLKDREGRYVMDNDAHRQSLGVQSQSEVEGKTSFDFFPHDKAKEFADDDRHVLESGVALINHEEFVPDALGNPRWLLTTKVPWRDEAGEVSRLVCIRRNITEQKLADEKLRHANADLSQALGNLKRASEQLRAIQLELIEAEKTKSIARLAAGVAHEVKNPLAIITMGVDYLQQQDFSADPNVPLILHDIVDAVQRADKVVRGLLDFSAPRQLEVQEEDLNEIIRRALVLVRGEMTPGKHRVEMDLQGDLPPVRLDRSKIEQVFINLMTNAIHAMPEGGTLRVRTNAHQLTGVGDNIATGQAAAFRVGQTVVTAEVADSGAGIPEDKLTKIFDPFFTTKPTGKGTGLGLTVTRSIIDLHGGTIDIANRPEGGARVTMMFHAAVTADSSNSQSQPQP